MTYVEVVTEMDKSKNIVLIVKGIKRTLIEISFGRLSILNKVINYFFSQIRPSF